MARITNDRFGPGEPLAAATLNTKFTDVATATTSLNADNMRAESVDIGNISTGTPLFIKAAGGAEHTTPQTYANGVLDVITGSEITPSPALSLAAGDLLRVYWNLQTAGMYMHGTGGRPDPIAAKAELGAFCWGVWLQYAATAGPSGWTEVPGQDGYGSTVTSPDGIDAENTAAFTPIPVCNFALAGPDPQATPTEKITQYPPSRSPAVRQDQMCSYMGAYVYKATAPLTIYGFRLRSRGLFYADADTSGTPDKGILVNQDSDFAATSVVWQVIRNSISYMLMRTV
jgi:hypothetical protein